MGTERLEERMAVVELKVDDHMHRIGKIEGKIESLHTDLNDLKRILTNIKWWLVGIGSFYVAQEVGILVLIKKFIGL